MRVDLAAQVSSVSSVSRAILFICGDEASETAHFVLMIDKFFDALNVKNYTDGCHRLKSFKLPYRSKSDMRIKVMLVVFFVF